MATLEFTKMHGCGNDYVYVVALRARPVDPSALSVKLSDRHFGVGGDGLIMLAPSSNAESVPVVRSSRMPAWLLRRIIRSPVVRCWKKA